MTEIGHPIPSCHHLDEAPKIFNSHKNSTHHLKNALKLFLNHDDIHNFFRVLFSLLLFIPLLCFLNEMKGRERERLKISQDYK